MKKTQNWKERLDEKFGEYLERAYEEKEDANLGDEIKSFISSELSNLAKGMIEKINELPTEFPEPEFDDGYNQAKSDIRQAQMELLKNKGIEI